MELIMQVHLASITGSCVLSEHMQVTEVTLSSMYVEEFKWSD